jgi:hypothetical protein
MIKIRAFGTCGIVKDIISSPGRRIPAGDLWLLLKWFQRENMRAGMGWRMKKSWTYYYLLDSGCGRECVPGLGVGRG